MHYHFSENETKALCSTLVVLHDTREQKNEHIIRWLDRHAVPHKRRSLATGDYSVMMPARPDCGLPCDVYFSAAIERKGSINELVQTVKDRTRFENELNRAQRLGYFALVVEDGDGYGRIVRGDYRSRYGSRALQASLAALSLRYGCPIHFISAELSPRWIYTHLYYYARERLRCAPRLRFG